MVDLRTTGSRAASRKLHFYVAHPLRRRRGARPTTLAANSGASAAITVYNSRKQIRQDLYQALKREGGILRRLFRPYRHYQCKKWYWVVK
jgi:hypothetical protein